MPSPATTQLPRPKSWDEFEDITADLLKVVWSDPYMTRNGRAGQRQHGVDIYGTPKDMGGTVAGAQCKRSDEIDIKTIEREVDEATGFVPPLGFYLIATTALRDAIVQEQVRVHAWPFRVHVWFWEDISLELSGHDTLLQKHFPGWMKRATTKQHVIDLIRASSPEDYTYDDSTGIFVYQNDLDLSLVQDREEEREFHESWATEKFCDRTAYRQLVYLTYRSARLFTMYFVHADGFRYILPIPKNPKELIITPFQYHVGRILTKSRPGSDCPGYDFDSGLRSAGIRVVEPRSPGKLTHNE